MQEQSLLVHVSDARKLLGGICKTKLFSLIAEPDNPLKRVKIGKRTYLRRSDIEAFIEKQIGSEAA